MDWLHNLGETLTKNLLVSLIVEFILVVLGVLVAHPIQAAIERYRFGKWRLLITKNGEEVLNDEISPGKIQAILDVPEDMAVFLRGRIRSFDFIHCDLMKDGPASGLLQIDRKARRIVIDLDKNPPDSRSPEERANPPDPRTAPRKPSPSP